VSVTPTRVETMRAYKVRLQVFIFCFIFTMLLNPQNHDTREGSTPHCVTISVTTRRGGSTPSRCVAISMTSVMTRREGSTPPRCVIISITTRRGGSTPPRCVIISITTHRGGSTPLHRAPFNTTTTPLWCCLSSVWKSSPKTGKRLELDRTWTDRTGNSQDCKRPQPQSGLRSVTILEIPGPNKDQSGPVWTGLCNLKG
jgi:hypothetical protein